MYLIIAVKLSPHFNRIVSKADTGMADPAEI